MERIRKYQKKLNSEYQELLDVAVSAALKAGKILRELYDNPHSVRFKGEIDLVTEADIASEKAILSLVKDKCPQIEVMAEESSAHNTDSISSRTWIIDPLDGTTNFAHGCPWFCVSIALWNRDHIELGVVYLPLQNELFYAVKGAGTCLNDRNINVSSTSSLNHSLLATGFPYDVREKPDLVMPAFKDMILKAQGVRRAGAAALDLAYVAAGRFDGFWEIKLKPWDTAAGMLLVEEAGGRVTDFANNSYTPFLKEILASNSLIHGDMVAVLKKYSLVTTNE